MSELANCKKQLAQVVDEVYYYQSELGVKERHVELLRQGLVDNTSAHAFVIEALNHQVSVLKKNHGNPSYRGMIHDAETTVQVAMDDLRGFQQGLQRLLVENRLDLPNPTFVRTHVPMTIGRGGVGGNNSYNSKDDDNEIDQGFFRNGKSASELLRILQDEREDWVRKEKQFTQLIENLRDELKRSQAAQVWPFKDDHRSFNDGFGMSSNSTDTASQMSSLRIQNSSLMEQKETRTDQSSKETTRLEDEVKRLKRLLREQEIQHEEQRKSLMLQTELELKDAERQILELRRELNHSGTNVFKLDTLSSPSSSRSVKQPKRRTLPTYHHHDEDGEAQLDELNEAVSHQLVSSDKATNYPLERITRLEQQLVMERKETERLKRVVQSSVREKEAAHAELEQLQVEFGLGREEFETERNQRQALRQELEKAHRDREIVAREYRAAERRHQGLMEEMKEVLLERDEAVAAREVARRKYLEGQQDLEKARTELQAAIKEKNVILEEKEKVEKENRVLNRSLDAEKRTKDTISQDVAILLQQKEAIAMERDSAIREQQNAMKRVDTAMNDRKMALEAKESALERVDQLQEEMSNVKIQFHRNEQSLRELRTQVQEMESERQELTQKLNDSNKALGDATHATAKEKELRINAEQEMEVAQRQYRALGEELKAVLRVRDIALEQRDAALQASKMSNTRGNNDDYDYDEDGVMMMKQQHKNQENINPIMDKETAKKMEKLCERVESLEVTLAAVEEEKQELEQLLQQQHPTNFSPKPPVASSNHDDASLVSLSGETIGRYKEKLVHLSHQIADIQESVRASYISMQSFLEDQATPKYSEWSGSAVSTATPGQPFPDIVFILSKQLQALEMDQNKQGRYISKLIESVRNAKAKAERFELESNLLLKSNNDSMGGVKHMQSLERNTNEIANKYEQERSRNLILSQELRDMKHNLQTMELKLEQSQSRIVHLQEKRFATDPLDSSSREGEELNVDIARLESQLASTQQELLTKERQFQQELEEERDQLKQALERLKVSDEKVLDLKRKLRTQQYELERLENERQRLAVHVENASSQLQGVAHQKSNAAKELEEVYTSLTELEKQLLASHAENNRLKQILASATSNPPRPDVNNANARRRSSTVSSARSSNSSKGRRSFALD